MDLIRRIEICMILEEMENNPDCAKRLGLVDYSHMRGEDLSFKDEDCKAVKEGVEL